MYCCRANSASNRSSWSALKMVRTRLVRGDAELLDKQVTDGEALALATGEVDVSRHSAKVSVDNF